MFSVGDVVNHPMYGNGRVTATNGERYKVYFAKKGEVEIAVNFDGLKSGREGVGELEQKLESIIWRLCEENVGLPDAVYEIGEKWKGGKVVITPGKEGVQSKEIDIDVFFKKIISVREKMRVLEQKINNHSKLDSGERMELVQYLSQAQGSLTTFNCLFDEKRSWFQGVKTSK